MGMKVHFMGIGGSGASGVARIAAATGYSVTGCDLEESSVTERIKREGIPVALGHDVSHLKGVTILAHTPAVYYQNAHHPEYTTAVKKDIALTWEEFTAKFLMQNKFVVSVAGTHGKGTTTAMLVRILEAAGLDPTCQLGANLLDWDRRNFRIGKSKYFVNEADEFREKFLLYKPNLLVVTSIEMDHPEYFRDTDQIIASFVKLAGQLRPPKILVVSKEYPLCQTFVNALKKKGFAGKIIWYDKNLITAQKVKLRHPGSHLQFDAAGAWTAAKALGVKEEVIKKALEDFSGLERRFEFKGEFAGVKVYDDYAHHPTAVRVNIAAIRSLYKSKRVWVVFQPHMHARLERLFQEFAAELRLADRVIVTDVYSRREQGVNQPTGKQLAQAIGPKATYVGGDVSNAAKFVQRNTKKGDVVVLMGAGDIGRAAEELINGGE